jgi:hypothetical protein
VATVAMINAQMSSDHEVRPSNDLFHPRDCIRLVSL